MRQSSAVDELIQDQFSVKRLSPKHPAMVALRAKLGEVESRYGVPQIGERLTEYLERVDVSAIDVQAITRLVVACERGFQLTQRLHVLEAVGSAAVQGYVQGLRGCYFRGRADEEGQDQKHRLEDLLADIVLHPDLVKGLREGVADVLARECERSEPIIRVLRSPDPNVIREALLSLVEGRSRLPEGVGEAVTEHLGGDINWRWAVQVCQKHGIPYAEQVARSSDPTVRAEALNDPHATIDTVQQILLQSDEREGTRNSAAIRFLSDPSAADASRLAGTREAVRRLSCVSYDNEEQARAIAPQLLALLMDGHVTQSDLESSAPIIRFAIIQEMNTEDRRHHALCEDFLKNDDQLTREAAALKLVESGECISEDVWHPALMTALNVKPLERPRREVSLLVSLALNGISPGSDRRDRVVATLGAMNRTEVSQSLALFLNVNRESERRVFVNCLSSFDREGDFDRLSLHVAHAIARAGERSRIALIEMWPKDLHDVLVAQLAELVDGGEITLTEETKQALQNTFPGFDSSAVGAL